MGVGGVLGGSMNKEPLQTYKDAEKNIGITITKKKKPVRENAVSKLETGLTKLQKTDYNTIDKLMTKISKDENTTGKDLHNDFVKKHGKVPDNWIKDKKQEK
jgi:ABC-type proline/glycine betaine transport system substrate-binding protein